MVLLSSLLCQGATDANLFIHYSEVGFPHFSFSFLKKYVLIASVPTLNSLPTFSDAQLSVQQPASWADSLNYS